MLTEEILMSLEKVKRTGNNRWVSDCPHGHHSHARLHISDAGDRTLLKCFAGCSTWNIVESMGLKISDLFHKEMTESVRKERRDFHSRERLRHEVLIVWIAYHDKRKGKLKPADAARANQAYKTLRKAQWL